MQLRGVSGFLPVTSLGALIIDIVSICCLSPSVAYLQWYEVFSPSIARISHLLHRFRCCDKRYVDFTGGYHLAGVGADQLIQFRWFGCQLVVVTHDIGWPSLWRLD